MLYYCAFDANRGKAVVAARSKNFLLTSLFLATIVPTVLPAIFVPLTGFHLTWAQFVIVIGVIGNAHVGMTAFFFMGDNRYKAIIEENRWRYIALPVISIAFAFLIFAIWPKGI